jgi:hypothetical protein
MTKPTFKLISASAAAVQAACSCDLMNKVEDDKDDVQLFPPGAHKITARMDGDPVELNVNIGEAEGNVIKRDFDRMLAEAKSGKGAMPFLDFNHEDRDASAWPKEIFWAGNDPVTGGIRAKVEWSEPGKQAVRGKAFRQFSPNFLIDTRTKQIIGTTPNMGGLVNRPAFRAIQPFFAKDGGSNNQPSTMKKLTALLASAGLISAANADNDELAAAEFAAKFDPIRAASATAVEQAKELGVVKAKLATISDENAERIVLQAVTEGRIAAKDDDTRASWKALIVADSKNAKLLSSIAVVNATDATKRIVVQGDPGKQAAAKEDGHPLVVLAKEIAKRDNLCLLYTSDSADEQCMV